jgi:hypothetical protein
MSDLSPQSGPKRTLISRCHPIAILRVLEARYPFLAAPLQGKLRSAYQPAQLYRLEPECIVLIDIQVTSDRRICSNSSARDPGKEPLASKLIPMSPCEGWKMRGRTRVG